MSVQLWSKALAPQSPDWTESDMPKVLVEAEKSHLALLPSYVLCADAQMRSLTDALVASKLVPRESMF